MGGRQSGVAWLLMVVPVGLFGQGQPELKEILTRLERLEQQNRELVSEVRALREQLASREPPAGDAAPVPVEERLALQERRVEEHEESKVSTDHKLPVTLTGTVLFNAFLNGRAGTGQQYPRTAALEEGPASGGATFRQTILGLRYDGPRVGGAKVSGTLYMDLFGGTGTSLNTLLRLRVAALDFSWKNTSLTFGHDKPILAPREPESLAQMGFSPLTGAGNLWLWQPQVKLEQRFGFGERAGLKAQFGVYQTNELGTGLPEEYRDDLASGRPGYEGRFELWKSFDGGRRIEIAPGFHVSDTHAVYTSTPSRIFSLDWLVRPYSRLDFSGAFFSGKNVGVLGGLRQGITVFPSGELRAIKAKGGWAQLTWRATDRVSFNWYAGQEDDRNADLLGETWRRTRCTRGT